MDTCSGPNSATEQRVGRNGLWGRATRSDAVTSVAKWLVKKLTPTSGLQLWEPALRPPDAQLKCLLYRAQTWHQHRDTVADVIENPVHGCRLEVLLKPGQRGAYLC